MTDVPVPMKKVQLERLLQSLDPLPSPRADLEQYATPPGIAAEVAYIAHGKGDLVGRSVLDAGCGAGVLGIAAKLLGAAEVVGVDIDPKCVEVARANAALVSAAVDWRCADVSSIHERFDTALMNPPFGSQQRHADLPFLAKALEVARVVYSFHNAVTEAFLTEWIGSRSARITDRLRYSFALPRAFRFHRDDVRAVPVILLRVESGGPDWA